MSLRSHSHVKASMVLTRADHLFTHNYIRSLLNIMLRPVITVRTRLEPASYCSRVRRLSELHSSIYLYVKSETLRCVIYINMH